MESSIIIPKNILNLSLESLETDSNGYNKFTRDSIINSTEYVTMFNYLKNKKTFNLDTKEGMDLHIYRNKNMYKKAPKDLQTMKEFVKAGYFLCEGFNPCHNLYKDINDYKNRKQTLSETIYLISHDKLYKPNSYSYCKNLSFRGTPHTSFEGCQFVYNIDSGKLVVDNINRGTWDYGQYATSVHFMLDIYPWLTFGNGENLETPNQFIMSSAEEKLFLSPEAINNLKNDEDVQKSLSFKEKYMINEFKKLITWLNEVTNVSIESGKSAKDKFDSIIKQSKEDFIDKYYEKNAKPINYTGLSNINMAYSEAWFNYINFLSTIENRDIIEGLQDKILYISTSPENLKDIITNPNEKSKYEEFMFKSVYDCVSTKEFNTTDMIQTKLPIKVSIRLTPKIIDNINDVNMKLGNTEAINQYHFFVDYIIEKLNEKVQKCGFEFRLIENPIVFDSDDIKVELSVVQIRMINCTERMLFSDKIIKLEKEKYVSDNPELKDILVKSDENLVIPNNPEYYSTEATKFGLNIFSVTSVALLTLIVGGTALIVDKVRNKDNQEKNIKKIAIIIEKKLSDYYDNLKKFDTSTKNVLKNSKIINTISDYDKYGEYNIYESNDFSNKTEWVRERAIELLEIIKRSKNYIEFVEILKNEFKTKNKLVDGYICKEIYEDTSLLDELTKFEYGENNDNNESRISYLKTTTQKMIDMILSGLRPIISDNNDCKTYFDTSENEIDTTKIGKYSIKNQLYFNYGYIKDINIDFDEIENELMVFIESNK